MYRLQYAQCSSGVANGYSTADDRPDRMQHIPTGQIKCRGNFCLSGRFGKALLFHQFLTGKPQLHARISVNGVINAAVVLIAVFRENVAVLAPLVAFIRDMPLERKILFHVIPLVVMGRISESVTAVAPSEIRPKIVFLERTPTFTACRQHRRQSRKQRASQRAYRQHRRPLQEQPQPFGSSQRD